MTGEIISTFEPQLSRLGMNPSYFWVRDFLLAPFMVGLAVFAAQLFFYWYQSPRPMLKLKSVDSRIPNRPIFVFYLVNDGRTALHSPLVNLKIGSLVMTTGDFSKGKTDCLIYKSTSPLLPHGIGQVLSLEATGNLPSVISFLIQGEEGGVRGEIDIEEWGRRSDTVTLT